MQFFLKTSQSLFRKLLVTPWRWCPCFIQSVMSRADEPALIKPTGVTIRKAHFNVKWGCKMKKVKIELLKISQIKSLETQSFHRVCSLCSFVPWPSLWEFCCSCCCCCLLANFFIWNEGVKVVRKPPPQSLLSVIGWLVQPGPHCFCWCFWSLGCPQRPDFFTAYSEDRQPADREEMFAVRD